MIINNLLDHIFINKTILAVLRVLNNRVIGITGRETSRIANISLRSAQLALDTLEKLKIVKRQVGGRDHLFTLNKEHFVVKEIISGLFSSEQKFKTSLLKKIGDQLNGLTESVILFGSVARNEETYDSDLDICIVYSKNKNKIEKVLNELRDEIYDLYGVTLAPFYISRNEFRKRVRREINPVNEIIVDGIIITGIPITKL